MTTIADPILKHYLWRWASAVSAQSIRIRTGIEAGTYENGGLDDGAGDFWSDCVLLLEALNQFYHWYDHARARWPSIKKLAGPNSIFRQEVADLRKMTIHADDFIQGRGRGGAQGRFSASTPFQHSATTVQVASGAVTPACHPADGRVLG